MNAIIIILAIIGCSVVACGVATILFGIFGPKEYIGANWIKRRLRAMGINTSEINKEVFRRAARNAYTTTLYGGYSEKRFNYIEFKSQLDFRSHLIFLYLTGRLTDETEIALVRLFFTVPRSS